MVQLFEEVNAEEVEDGFVAGTFVIARYHTVRMYLIAFGTFFCWCKVAVGSGLNLGQLCGKTIFSQR